MAIDPTQLEEQKRLNELKEQEIALNTRLTSQREEFNDAVMRGASNTKELADAMSQTQKELTEVSDQLDKFTYSTEQAEGSQIKLTAALAGIGGMLPGLIGNFDALYGTQLASLTSFEKAIPAVSKFATVIHDTQVELRRATGFQDRYSRAFTRLKTAYQSVNLPQEVLAQNLTSLNQNFTAFDSLSPAMRDNLTMLAGNMTLLGMSGDTTAKVLDDLRFGFGIMGQESVKAFGDLLKLSKETGIDMEELGQSLNDLAPTLARFGSEGDRVFASLTKRARTLGLTARDAFNVAEQVDTFRGAMDVVGRLNVQFGMQLDAVELMKANHTERVDLLREEFSLQGKSFQQLHRRQKQMIANILGMEELEAAKFFGDPMAIEQIGEDRGTLTSIDKLTKNQDRVTAMSEKVFDNVLERLGGVQKVNDMQIGLLKTMQANTGLVTDALMTIAVTTGAVGAGSGVLKLIKNTPLGQKLGTKIAEMGGKEVTKTATREVAETAAKEATKNVVRETGKGLTKGVVGTILKTGGKTLAKGIGGAVVGTGINLATGDSFGRSLTTGIAGAIGGLASVAGVAAATSGVGFLGSFATYAAGSAATEMAAGAIYDKIFGKPEMKALATAPNELSKQTAANQKILAEAQKNAKSGRTIELNIDELVVKSEIDLDGKRVGVGMEKYFNTRLQPTTSQ